MGFRDRLKDTAKALLGRGEAPRPPEARPPAPPPPRPAAAPPAPRPAPTASAPPPAAPAGPIKVGDEVDGWRAVAPSARVAVGKAGTFPIPGYVVAVFRHGGALYAIDNACAHEDGPVGEGDISGACVKCPYHDWEYDFTTGACRTDPERALATFAVREHDGFIWVGARLTDGTGARGGDHNDGLETITR